jgi:hypothetical protein
MEIKIFDLEESVEKYPELKRGCIVDSNVLFAGSYPSDTYNDWADDVFKTLNCIGISAYTNLNVRSEFLDLHRRVLIPEGLVDFYDDLSETLEGKIYEKLKYLKRRAKDARDKGRPLKFNDSEVKEYMDILGHEPRSNGVSGWTVFCQSYFAPYVTDVWEDAVNDLKINFLGSREIESKEFFDKHPSWSNMIKILGDSGIGSADAMILNLFKESKLPLLITADKAVRNAMLNNSFDGKFVLCP